MQINAKMAEQVGVVVCEAREHFADAVEEYMRNKKTDNGFVSLNDKLEIERLFTEAVNSYIIAELAAIVSHVIYDELKNKEILEKIVPAFIDQYEGTIPRLPDDLINKTVDLTEIANRVLEAQANKTDIVKALLRDVSLNAKTKHMHASFAACALNFLGE